MGKSSGGSSGTGSQTIIQDVAEPFKGFATRSLQRAEDLQGLPSIPFTGIATAPPSPDELVAAQALRNRFMEGQPLTQEALALQSTAADPITAASIQARQNPFEALIAQEAYRRLGERTQLDLQKQRAREVGAGGSDRGRGAIEDHLIQQRAADQERRIGLEAGQRAFTDASQLATGDRQARADTAAGINARLNERQAMGRRDIDDLLRVGAQFREKFVQPELNLERQQFGEFRGPASVQNPFGFEQFFSGIRSAAPTPGVTTSQNFAPTPSGLSQAVPAIGGAISAGHQLGAFNQGGIANFHKGGMAEHQRVGHTHPELDPAVITQVIATLQQQGHLSEGPQARIELMNRIQSDPSFKLLFDETMAGVVEGPGYVPQDLNIETLLDQAPQSRETGRSDFDAMVDTHGQLAKGFTDEQQPESAAQEQPRGYGLLGSGDKPRGMITENRALERLAAEERVSGIEAAALARAEEEMGNRAVSSSSPSITNVMQYATGIGPDRTTSAQRGQQWQVPGQGAEVEEETLSPEALREDANVDMERVERIKRGARGGIGDDLYETYRTDALEGTDMIPKGRAIARHLADFPVVAEEEDFAESVSSPDMDDGSNVGMAPYVGEEEAPAEYWAESMEGLPDRMAEMVEGRAVSPKAPEPERKYTDSEITAMMQFSMSGRGRERLPKEMFGLSTLEVQDALEPIRERARKASAPRRAQERRDRIANRRSFGGRGGIKDSDTPSYDITFDDVKEIFNFKDGGLTSLNQGGIARFDNGSEVELQEEFKETIRRFVPKSKQQSRQSWKDAKRVALGEVPNYPAMSEELMEAGKELNQGKIYDESVSYADAYKGTKKVRDAAEARIKKVEDEAKKLEDAEKAKAKAEPKEEPRKNQIELMMEEYRNSFSTPTKKGYPDRIPLSDKQRKGAAIQAFANALMAVKSDKFGGTDFSGMGPAAAQSAQKTLAGYEAARKQEIATRTAQRAAMLEGAEKFSNIYKNMGDTQKARADAAVAQAKADYPGLEIIKAVAPALAIKLAQGEITQAKYDEALQGAVESFLRQRGGNTGLAQDKFDTEAAKIAAEH